MMAKKQRLPSYAHFPGFDSPEHVSLLGKMSPMERTSPQEVLFLFYRLLDVYLYVEGSIPLKRRKAEVYKGFVFEPGCPEKPQAAIYVSKTSPCHCPPP